MVAKGNDERDFTVGSTGKDGTHRGIGRGGVDYIARKDDQIGAFGIEHFANTFQGYVRSRVAILEMNICKLNDFKLTVLVELQRRYLCPAEQGGKERQAKG